MISSEAVSALSKGVDDSSPVLAVDLILKGITSELADRLRPTNRKEWAVSRNHRQSRSSRIYALPFPARPDYSNALKIRSSKLTLPGRSEQPSYCNSIVRSGLAITVIDVGHRIGEQEASDFLSLRDNARRCFL
jgi:hypothetical protein